MPLPKLSIDVSKIKSKMDEKTLKAVENGLKDGLLSILDRIEEIDKIIKSLEKAPVVPKAFESSLKAQNTIISGKEKEVKDLKNSQKRGELHTNPAKLKRLCEELNEQTVEVERLIAEFPAALDAEMAAHFEKDYADPLKKHYEKEGSPKTFALKHAMDHAEKTLKKDNWKKYGEVGRWLDLDKAEIDKKARLRDLDVLKNKYPTLNVKRRTNMLNKAKAQIDGGNTAKALLTALEDALDEALGAQQAPPLGIWKQVLGMSGYQVVKTGQKYDGHEIHLTYDDNSWSAAGKGGISVKGAKAEDVLDALLNLSDWTYQMHATLELPDSNGKNAHVYFGGHANHWNTVAATHGKDVKWQNAGIAKVGAVMASAKDQMTKKIKKFIDADGDMDRM
jgi:hypothetical protein